MAKRPNDALLQTRVSEDVERWVRKAAESEGLSVAAWLRRLVLVAKQGASKTPLRP
jgi:hypothetical protein